MTTKFILLSAVVLLTQPTATTAQTSRRASAPAPAATAGSRVNVPGGFSIAVPPGWGYNYLRISSMLPNRAGQDLGNQESETFPPATPAAQLARCNGVQLYRLADAEDQLMVFVHEATPALTQNEFRAVLPDPSTKVRPDKAGGLPAYRAENTAYGLTFVNVYAYHLTRRYGFTVTRSSAKIAPLQSALTQVLASFALTRK